MQGTNPQGNLSSAEEESALKVLKKEHLSSVLFLFIHYLVNLEDVITDKFKKFEFLSK